MRTPRLLELSRYYTSTQLAVRILFSHGSH
jgi:hypothetical protein